MTWLDLIDELRKQPLHLLERDVCIHNRIMNNGRETNLVTTPYELFDESLDYSSDASDWKDGTCFISLECECDVPDSFFTECRNFDATVKQKQKKTYLVDMSTSVWQTFLIEADSYEEACAKTDHLEGNTKFYEGFLEGKWIHDKDHMREVAGVDNVQEWEREDRYRIVTDEDFERFTDLSKED